MGHSYCASQASASTFISGSRVVSLLVKGQRLTTGSVIFAKYAVQVGLQEDFDQSQVPANATSGYYP
jgi:purine nucleoside permease